MTEQTSSGEMQHLHACRCSFMWLLLQGRIQCRSVLHRKNVLPDCTCEVCNEDDETPEHIISGCNLGKQFWEKLGATSMVGISVTNIHRTTPPNGVPKEGYSAFIALACWQLWKARNATVFREERHNITQVFAACKASAEQWRYRFPRRKRPIVDQWCQVFESTRNG